MKAGIAIPFQQMADSLEDPTTLAARDLNVFWHPCSQMRDYRDFPPLEIVGAQGTRLRLSDGREILDAISSWWCKSLGHGHAGVRARITQQLQSFEHVIAANTTNAPLVELCERLVALANGAPVAHWGPRATEQPRVNVARPHFAKVFLAENGSTAVEVALKMALQAQAQTGHPERFRFAALSGGYHGETVGALSVGDLGLYAAPFESMMFPVHKLGPVPYRTGPDDPRWQDASAEWAVLEAQLKPLAANLAAIIYEPVLQAAGGMRPYSPDVLRRLRRFADENGIYLIADEIAVGMGRLGRMVASDWATDGTDTDLHGAGLADFLLLGKGLTAGFLPLAAVVTTNAVYAAFDSDWSERRAFLHSNTHTANALTIAAALGALDAYANDSILEHVASHGPRLIERLRAAADARPTMTHVRGIGMVAAVDLQSANGESLNPRARAGYHVYQEAVRRGALLRPLGDTMYIFPPLNSSTEDLDQMVEILVQSIDAIVT